MKKIRTSAKSRKAERKQATGKSPELAGRNACPTSGERKRLVAILEEYGVSVAGFDGLRSDSYEKHIAQRSLDELERLYEVLFGGPARGYAEIISECPTWGKSNKPPHRSTLQAIRQRIIAEQSMRERMSVDSFVAEEGKAQNPRSKVPSPGTAEYFESAVRILSRELLSSKLDGKPISENLRVMDRLLKAAAIGFRKKYAEQRVELAKETLEIRKANDEIRNKRLKAKDKAEAQSGEGETSVQPDMEAEGDEEWGMTEDEKSAALLERAFGKPPPHVLAKYPFMLKNLAPEKAKAETGEGPTSKPTNGIQN